MPHIGDAWDDGTGDVGHHIAELNQKCLAAYAANDALIEEHANAERVQTQGGYGRRQVWELIQNGADEMLDDPGRVHVVLTEEHLYCANQGRPVTPEGAGAILSAYRSSKRGPEIGRFGLGFKSVLGVSATPEFFSRAGSFAFSPEFSSSQIKTVVKGVKRPPTLRLAMTLNPKASAASDPILADLMRWATTVVRLPLDKDGGDWLHGDLARFPPEFLVFSPHISELVLDDRISERRREIRLQPGEREFEHLLIEGDTSDVWRVFTTDVKPSKAAAKDGGAMADREVVRLQWAVPIRARQRIGGLWAYFPTLEETTLSGVINAPWKLNDDRTRVIDGPFNTELLKRATDLVLSHLEVLTAKDDPGNILDILPARGREERNWADGFLTEQINAEAGVHASIPDQSGVLELPGSLTLHPEKLGTDALERWAKVPTKPQDWAHRSVDLTQTRRSRAERFIDAGNGRRATVAQWLEALIPEPDSETGNDLTAIGHSLLVAALAVQANPELTELIRNAHIVADVDGELVRPLDVMLPGEYKVTAPGIRLVHKALVKHPKTRAALIALGVQQVDADLELRALLETRDPKQIGQDWDTIWALAGRTSAPAALTILAEFGFDADRLRVRVASGEYLPISATLMPGEIARTETAPSVVIDIEHHREHLQLLRSLGATSAPTAGGAREGEPAMRDFRNRAADTYVAKAGRNSNPDRTKVKIDIGQVAGPLTPLEGLDGLPKARYTRALLDAQPAFTRCELSYPNNRYPATTIEHPIIELIRHHGVAETSSGLVEASLWVGPMLRNWSALLPVAEIPRMASEALGIPQSLDELTDEQWASAHAKAIETADLELAGRFYSVACRTEGLVPATLLARVGDQASEVKTGDVRVSATPRTTAVLRAGGIPVLELSEDDAEALIEKWSVRRGDDEIARELVAIESSPRVPLIDLFPALKRMLDDRQQDLEVVRCSEIRIEISAAGGRDSEPVLIYRDGDLIFADESLDQPALLARLGEQLGLDLDAARIDAIIANKLNQEIRARISELRKKKTAAEKLAVVVSAETLRSELPAPLLQAVTTPDGDIYHVTLARLAFAVHGVETLKIFRGDFEALGLQPPKNWAGSWQAIEFVESLGFGRELAGFPAATRESKLLVDGPPALNELHDYQRTVVTEIQRVLRQDPTLQRPRGMVSLPTGAGKTRVAVQAMVEAMLNGTLGSPVLWVAQRDELCEQAVQAWSEVWRDRGPNQRLTVSRLWSSNEAELVTDGPQVVVATIAKLDGPVMEGATYEWLSKASCVVIDEAHGAIAPAYTRLLEWQQMDRAKDRAPLIGLTATPYRGMSAEETKRLVNRFGKWRMDQAAFGENEPYRELQKMGVLSRVEHRTLPGSDIELSDKEVTELKRTRLMPASASDRLASDTDRNRVLLESIKAHPDDWTVLLFCASLEHASVMAGLLTEAGIPSASVSGTTPPAARRHYVEEFRAGRLRVLTNYAVFAAGFDAPMVRAVYVARPTYSPNVYQQMIGRGLRGPLNGGSEECLIVNVADNVTNFGDALAFRMFEELWAPESA